jgi:glycosyltransferase involved in cell wall biosynthesis
MLDRLFPRGSDRRKVAIKTYRTITFSPAIDPYQRWAMEQNDQIRLLPNKHLVGKPLISIIIPAFNTPQRYLLPCVYSVVAQSYQEWELIIVDASTEDSARECIKATADIDKRIKVFPIANEGIAANTNAGLKHAQGAYVGFLDHDDLLTDDALQEVAAAINEHPEAGLFYSDEDKITENGAHYLNPHFKPDWSPDLLTHVNYITHFMVVKKSLATKVGAFDSRKDGSQDYDFALKITDLGDPVIHIPKILYHWRLAKNSTAADISNKPYVKNAGVQALKDHYARLKVKATVNALPTKPGFYETNIISSTKPTIIITPFANPVCVELYAKLFRKHVPESIEVRTPKSDDYAMSPKSFISRSLKTAAPHVIFINDFVFPETAGWATALANLMELPHVHAAASIVYRQDKKIEDAGIVTRGHIAQNLFQNKLRATNTYFGDTDWTRNVDRLSGRTVAVRNRELLEQLDKLSGEDVVELLHNYTRRKGEGYNTVLSTSPLLQLRASARKPRSRFMNPNLSQTGPRLELASNEQQVLDALVKMKEDLDEG